MAAASPLIGFVADDGDAGFPDEVMAGGDWQPVRVQAASNIVANHFFISRIGIKILRGHVFETRAVVGLEPVERAAFLRVQSELVAFPNEESTLFRVFHRAARFHFI